MMTINATEVRKEWSSVVDGVIRERPILIKRTRDKIWLSDNGRYFECISIYCGTFCGRRCFHNIIIK